jgi:hypothetical protein
MPITFTFGKGRLGPEACYDFTDWKRLPASRLPSEARRIAFQPGLRTSLRRLGGTAVAAFALAGVYFLYQEFDSLGGASNEFVAVGRGVCLGVGGLIGLAGLLAPLSCLWNRIAIDCDARGNLVVTAWKLLPRTKTWPMDSFSRMYVLAQSVVTGQRGVRRLLGYRWQVRLEGAHSVEFRPDFQKDAPMPGKFSPRTAQFLAALSQLTGLSCEAPVVVDPSGPRTNVACQRVSGGAPIVQTYSSLDDLPEEFRAQVNQVRTEAMISNTPQTIRFRDADGREHTYQSPEEMPPEIRAIYEQMRRKHGG